MEQWRGCCLADLDPDVAHSVPPEKSAVLSLADLATRAVCDDTAPPRSAAAIPPEIVLRILSHLKRFNKYDPDKHFHHWVTKGTTDLEFKRPTARGCEVTDEIVDLFFAPSPRGCGDSLVSLTLSDCSITDQGIAALLPLCPRLEAIHLQWCDNITDRSLQRIGKDKPNLRHLTVKGCANTTKLGVQFVVNHCTALETLRVSYADDTVLQQLANKCGCLRTLDLDSCSDITDRGLRGLSKSPTQLPNALTELSLYKCRQITDKGLKPLLSKFHRLKVLNLTLCERLTDDSLDCIARELGDSVESLQMPSCDGITADGVNSLSSCRKLKSLNIKDCNGILKSGISKLRKALPRTQIEI